MRAIALTAALFCFMSPSSTFSQEPTLAEIAKRAKAATALVEVANVKHGSAFCLHESGIYLTNDHVVRGVAEVKLVLHPGLKHQQIVKAQVIRSDKELDLALLRVLDKAKHVTLSLGSSDELVELAEVIAIGFPFGKALAAKGEYPNVSVNTGRVSALRLKKGELDRIQLDAVVNPGNSGGPVLDRKGLVVGVVVSGIRGSTVNFAIPVSHVQKFVATPEIEVVLPSVAYADRFKPAPFQIRAVTFMGSKDEYDVELILGGNGKAERSFAMPMKDGVYRATAAAMPKVEGPDTIRLTLTYPGGSVQGRAPNQSFLLGRETIYLKELRSLRFDKNATALLVNGKSVVGTLKNFDRITVDLGGEEIKLDPTKAREIAVQSTPVEFTVACSFVVRRGKHVLARVENILAFKDLPAPVVADAGKNFVTPPTLSADVTTVKLPGTVDDLAVGGNGRFLVLHLAPTRSLAVFDVSSARIAHTISLTDNNMVFTAGQDKIIVAYPATNIFVRYNLATGEREMVKTIEMRDKILRLSMGSASSGPILVGGPSRPPVDEWLRIVFLDIDFQILPAYTKDDCIIGFRNEGKLSVRASPNGRIFSMWVPGSGNVQVLHYDSPIHRLFANRERAGSLVPSQDGSIIYSSFNGHYTNHAKAIEGTRANKRTISVPAHRHPYYLRVATANAFVKLNSLPSGATVHLAGDSRAIATVPISDEMPENRDPWGETSLTMDRRVHFIPDAKVIVQLPRGDDRLLLYRFDMDAALAKADFDYLIVTSKPPSEARRGEALSYDIRANSKRGGVRCKLLAGPAGMTVTPAGLVAWQVPGDYKTGDVDVIVAITDASQQEIFHSFKFAVR